MFLIFEPQRQETEKMRPTLFSGKRLYTLLHVTAWILILLIPYIIHTLYGLGSLRHLFHIYIFLGIYGIIFYVNYLLLIPRLYFNEKKSAYLLTAVGLILVMFSLYALVNYFAFNASLIKNGKAGNVLIHLILWLNFET